MNRRHIFPPDGPSGGKSSRDGRLTHRLAWVVLVGVVATISMSGAASGQPGDLFELRAGGDGDWAPTSGALLTSSGSKLTASGVLASPFGSAAYEVAAGPGVARASFAGTFTNPPLETRRLNPSTFTRATTRLTVSGPDGIVNVRFKAHIDATVVHTCPADFVCGSDVTVFVGDQNTVVIGPGGGASPNLLGLSVDAVPAGYRVHGDYVSAPRSVTANAPFDAQLSLQLHVAILGRGTADSSSFDARGEVSFPTTGTVLDVPAGYTVTGENVEDNRWVDPFAPPPVPDIELRFANGSSIGSGDVLDLGTIASGASSPAASFNIANTGAADLHLQPLTAPTGFAIADQPDATVAGGQTTTADLTCSGSNPGSTPIVFDEVIRVSSDDPDEGSLDLRVRCTVLAGSAPLAPDIELRLDDGAPMQPPFLLDLGDVASGSTATAGYRIANVGTAALTITGITNDAPVGRGSASLLGAATVAPGASTTADVSCGGFNNGDLQLNVLFRVRVYSNDADESPADVLVRCHVLPATEPDIALFFSDGTPMGSNAILDVGDVPSGVTARRSYGIGNSGDAQLTIASIIATKPQFGLGEVFDPDDSTIDPGDSARAQVGCGGTNTSGSPVEVEFEVRVPSNDPDESPASFLARCTVQPAPRPDVELRFVDETPMPTDNAVLDVGNVPSGTYVRENFRVANVGTGPLTVMRLMGDLLDDGFPSASDASWPNSNWVVLPGESYGQGFSARCGGMNPGTAPRQVDSSVRVTERRPGRGSRHLHCALQRAAWRCDATHGHWCR